MKDTDIEFNWYSLDMALKNELANTQSLAVSSSNLAAGGSGTVVGAGDLRSQNFATGLVGWRLDSNGNLEANDGVFRGTLTATTGTIGGWNINATSIYTGTEDHSGYTANEGDLTIYSDGSDASIHANKFYIDATGKFFGSSGAVSGVSITAIPNDTSTDISLLEATHDLVFSVTDKDTVAWALGTITLSNGRTFSISAGNTGNMAARTYIYLDTATSLTVLQTTTTVATAMGANKKLIAVAQNGTAQPQYTVYGGIGGLKLPATATSISNNNWNFSGTWSVTDADTVAWGAGTLTTSDGGSYSITGSNTGNMSAKTYIYFDLGTSATAFQTTTTAATAVGDGKILIAIAQNGAGEANYIVVNDKQLNIEAGSIVAGSITANEIATGTITADRMDVSELSAIAADLGTITAGSININSGKATIASTGVATFTDVDIGTRYITVDPGENIQTAINLVSTGGGIVVLTPGTHTCDYDITIPSGVYLHGVNRTTSIIDFNSNSKSVIAQGSGAYSTGTVTISNGDTTVVGDSTSWNGNITAGQSILIGGVWYPITVVTDDTHITIALAYAGEDLSGSAYMVATPVKDVLIKDLTIKNSAGSAVKWAYVNNSNIYNVEVQTSATGLDWDYVAQSQIIYFNLVACNTNLDFNNVYHGTFYSAGIVNSQVGNGMTLNTVNGCKFDSIFILNSAADGINLTSCVNVLFIGVISSENTGQGVEFVSGNSRIVFNGCAFENNDSDGVKLTATSDNSFVQNSSIKGNGGYGVNIAASTCDNNLITGNIFDTNTSGHISNSGTGTVISGNVPNSENPSVEGETVSNTGAGPTTMLGNVSVTATCSAGYFVAGGGGTNSTISSSALALSESYQASATSWKVSYACHNGGGCDANTITCYARCVKP